MAVPVRVTGAWTQLLSDWLDVHQLAAPDLRLRLDSRRPDEPVPMLLWQPARLRCTHRARRHCGLYVPQRHVRSASSSCGAKPFQC